MPKLILTSKSAVWNESASAPYPGIIEALRAAKEQKIATFLVSNHARPEWLTGDLDFIQFQQCGFRPPRQSGKIVGALVETNKAKGLTASDIVVLGADDVDMMMAANSQSVLIRCEWARPLGTKISKYGVPFADPAAVPLVLRLLDGSSPWYFIHEGDFLTVYAVSDAGTMFEPNAAIIRLVNKLKGCLKDGSRELQKGFVLHFISSLYSTEVFKSVDVWGYYPSSASGNDEGEVMADFCTLAREMYKKRSRGPLFIRHTRSVKRHLVGGDRTDPKSQIDSIHINPAYMGHLQGKTVAVLDDYLTKGLSFGVAAALLKEAGVAKVIGVAMGKFGKSANIYNIEIESDDVFSPIQSARLLSLSQMNGTYDRSAQTGFLDKFAGVI